MRQQYNMALRRATSHATCNEAHRPRSAGSPTDLQYGPSRASSCAAAAPPGRPAAPGSTRQHPSVPGSTSRTSGGSDVYSVGCDTLHAADRQRRFGGSGSTHRYSVTKSLESGTGSHSAESAWATGRSGRGCTRAVSGRQRLQAHTKRDCNVCVCVCLGWES